MKEASRILALTLLLSILYSIDFIGLRLQVDLVTAPYVFTMALLGTLAVSYTIHHSRWRGAKLSAAIFMIFYGLRTLLTQVETLVFVPEYAAMIPGILVNDAIAILIFSTVSVLVNSGKLEGRISLGDGRLDMPLAQWLWKPALIAALYVLIYILFGLFVFRPIASFLDPEALSLYMDVETPAWILQFQLIRGLGFLAITLPIVKLLDGPWRQTGLAVALLYAFIMGGNLVVPMSAIPTSMRLAHFIEVFAENFFFGWAVVWILRARTPWAK